MANTVKIQYTAPNVYTVRAGKHTTRFLPGINSVPAASWEKIKGGKLVKARLASGELKVVGQATADAPPNARELAAEMPNIFDVQILRQFAEDSRVTVSDAAKKQLAAIDEKGEPEGKGEGEGDEEVDGETGADG